MNDGNDSDDDDATVFGRSHLLATQLMRLLSRDNVQLSDVLDTLRCWRLVIQESSSSSLVDERSAVTAAVLCAGGVAIRQARFPRSARAALAHCVADSLQRPDLSTFTSLWPHCRHLIAAFSDSLGSPALVAVDAQALLSALTRLVKLTECKELYANASLPLVGSIVSAALAIASNADRYDLTVRCESLDLLDVIVTRTEVRALSFVLPGCATELARLAMLPIDRSPLRLLELVVGLIGRLCMRCLCDAEVDWSVSDEKPASGEEKEGEETLATVCRDQEWWMRTAGGVAHVWQNITGPLLARKQPALTTLTLNTLLELIRDCSKSMRRSLDMLAIQSALPHLLDPNQPTVESARSLLQFVRESAPLTVASQLDSTVTKLMDRIRSNMSAALDKRAVDKLPEQLSELTSVCYALGDSLARSLDYEPSCSTYNDDSEWTLGSSALADQIVDVCLETVHLDLTRLTVSSVTEDVARGCSIDHLKSWIASLPLLYDVRWTHMAGVLDQVATSVGRRRVLEGLVSSWNPSSPNAKTFCRSCAILHLLLLAPIECCDLDILMSVARLSSMTLVDMQFERRTVSEQTISDCSINHSTSTMLSAVLALISSETILRLADLGEDCQANLLLLDLLYSLLRLYALPNSVLTDCVRMALARLSQRQDSSDPSLLMVRYASFVLDRTAAARRRGEWIGASSVFVAWVQLLPKDNGQHVFDAVRALLDELLLAVDLNYETGVLPALQAARAFLGRLGDWFPHLKCEDLQETEDAQCEKPPPPAPVALVQSILQRTRHLLSHPHLPVRVCVLNIIERAFTALRDCEDQLLPSIHEHWPLVLSRLHDSEAVCVAHAFRTAVVMARVSQTFVYRRVVEQLWPKIRSDVSRAITRNTPLYAHSGDILLHSTFVENICELFALVEASSTTMSEAIDLLSGYQSLVCCPIDLRKTAALAHSRMISMRTDRLAEERTRQSGE